MPLRVREELIGLLAVYPERGRGLTRERGVAPARARRSARGRGAERAAARAGRAAGRRARGGARRRARRRRSACARSTRSRARSRESLSLDATLEAVGAHDRRRRSTSTPPCSRMPDERGDLARARRACTCGTSGWTSRCARSSRCRSRFHRCARPSSAAVSALVLDADGAAALGPAHEPLDPVPREGLDGRGRSRSSTPAGDPADADPALARLGPADRRRDARGGALDRRPGRARARQRAPVPAAEGVRGHDAALAPPARRSPQLEELEVGDVYESSARVDVGGDVYDFLELADGRLAVVLGDVTGHGIDATADMAMAKFVFRSLAREHPEPGDFLAAANDVVRRRDRARASSSRCSTSTVDPVATASSRAPAPAIRRRGSLLPGGTSGASVARGPRARHRRRPGVRGGACASSDPGAAIVLYTDGVVEARRDGELYGEQRLDAAAGGERAASRPGAGDALLADCRAFGGGELGDDCAIVVIKRTLIDLGRRDGRMLRSATAARRRSRRRTRLAVDRGGGRARLSTSSSSTCSSADRSARARARPADRAGSPELPTLDEALALPGRHRGRRRSST